MANPTKSNLKDFTFLQSLQNQGYLGWPIDFECNEQTSESVAETLGYWFGHDQWKQDGGSFFQFGQDGTGSLYCVWFYPGLEGEPPVVFFGSEGQRQLVSDNTNDFVVLITSGLLPFDGDWIEPSNEDIKEIDWASLKELGQRHTGIKDIDVADLINKAKKNHPSFKEWVSKHTA